MKYISPFTLLDVEPENIDSISIQRAKKRWLAEFELARTTTVKIRGKEFDKNGMLNLADELNDPERLKVHTEIFHYKSLFNFLEKSNVDFFQEPFRPDQLGENALEEIATCFSDHYSEVFVNAYDQLDPATMRKMKVEHPLINSEVQQKIKKSITEKLVKQQNEVINIVKTAQHKKWLATAITDNLLTQIYVYYIIPAQYKKQIRFYLQPKLAECINLLPDSMYPDRYIINEYIGMIIRFAPDPLFETNRIAMAKIYHTMVASIAMKNNLNAIIQQQQNETHEIKQVPIRLAQMTGYFMLLPSWIFLGTRSYYFFFQFDTIKVLQPDFVFYNFLTGVFAVIGIILACTYTLYNVKPKKGWWLLGIIFGNILVLPIFWKKFLYRKDDNKCKLLLIVTILLAIETALIAVLRLMK